MTSAIPQTWNPDQYARNAGFVPALGLPVVELLDPQPGERILDLGCGDGVLTEKLASLGCQVVGVDSSAAQVAAAQARGLDARVVDAHELPFEAEFDAVFSNAALHWMRQPEAVIAGVWRALEPGGRFVGELGGAGNIAPVLDGAGRPCWPAAASIRSRPAPGTSPTRRSIAASWSRPASS